MLKKKLAKNLASPVKKLDEDNIENCVDESTEGIITSNLFAEPLWKRFYHLECLLNREVAALKPPANITHTYNPVEYAAEIHVEYLRRYLKNDEKKLVFVGMNPGPNGMGQTGVPFGNIGTVRDKMMITGHVDLPPALHPKRPVKGLNCTTEEPSGVRIWNLFERLAGGSLDNFSRLCFIHNFCPLAFFDKNGRNITPSELKGDYKTDIRDTCLRTLKSQLELLKPEILVAVGDYVYTTCTKGLDATNYKILKIPHPSPRALNNTNWPEKAEKWLVENNLMGYFNGGVST